MTTGLLAMRFALVLAAGFAVGAAQAQQAYRCVRPDGSIMIQQTPCKDESPPPPSPPPKKLLCNLSTEQIRRASRLENQFLARFPDEAAHGKAEAADVKPVVERIQVAKARRDELMEQRKPLEKELEFYKGGKPVPSWLKSKIDANDAHLAAVDEILKNREQELVEIKGRFQCQRDTFGKMWAGAAPGSSDCNRPPCAPP